MSAGSVADAELGQVTASRGVAEIGCELRTAVDKGFHVYPLLGRLERRGQTDAEASAEAKLVNAYWRLHHGCVESALGFLRLLTEPLTLIQREQMADMAAAVAVWDFGTQDRFVPDASSVEAFACESWVRCGRCQTSGVLLALPHSRPQFTCTHCLWTPHWPTAKTSPLFGPASFTGTAGCEGCFTKVTARATVDLDGSWPGARSESCPTCGRTVRVPLEFQHVVRGGTPREPHLGLPLLLAAEFRSRWVFAYNERHLNQLRGYVAARLRDETGNTGSSWSARLPSWIKAAKNRDDILTRLDRLTETAETCGPSTWCSTSLTARNGDSDHRRPGHCERR